MSIEDRAQELELRVWERNNAVRQRKTYAEGDEGYGPAECDECENPMPEQRRIDGRRFCTACQTGIERKRKLLS